MRPGASRASDVLKIDGVGISPLGISLDDGSKVHSVLQCAAILAILVLEDPPQDQPGSSVTNSREMTLDLTV